jgi:hypothetical protein
MREIEDEPEIDGRGLPEPSWMTHRGESIGQQAIVSRPR